MDEEGKQVFDPDTMVPKMQTTQWRGKEVVDAKTGEVVAASPGYFVTQEEWKLVQEQKGASEAELRVLPLAPGVWVRVKHEKLVADSGRGSKSVSVKASLSIVDEEVRVSLKERTTGNEPKWLPTAGTEGRVMWQVKSLLLEKEPKWRVEFENGHSYDLLSSEITTELVPQRVLIHKVVDDKSTGIDDILRAIAGDERRDGGADTELLAASYSLVKAAQGAFNPSRVEQRREDTRERENRQADLALSLLNTAFEEVAEERELAEADSEEHRFAENAAEVLEIEGADKEH